MLHNEQKGGHRGSRGTKNQLLIDQIILTNCRKAKKNPAIVLIDYMKASVRHGVPFMEDIEMPDGQRMKQIEESGYKYLGIIISSYYQRLK